MRSSEPEIERIDPKQIISLVLSIYVFGALIAETIFKLSPQTIELLDKIDFIICFFFLYDFAARFYAAKSKLQFLKWGWLDLLSSIPFWGGFQWARAARIVRILRAFRSTKVLLQYLYKDRAHGTLLSAVLVAIVMILFSSVTILNVETDPASNIKSPEDALWWAFTTVSTVGYGDKYPVTTEGRLTAVLLIISGAGLFGIYTAFIAKLFVAEQDKDGDVQIKLLTEEIRLLRLRVEGWELAQNNKNSQENRPERSEVTSEN